jgi:tetratricopeptide (TPR) repeat protein
MFLPLLLCLFLLTSASAQQTPGDADLRRAVELHQSGHYQEAIPLYQAFLKEHPEAVPVRSNLGAALAHEGRYTEAIQEYSLALKSQPTNFGIRFNLGLAYYKMGNVADAVKEFEEVRATMPADASEQTRLVLLLSECYLRFAENDKVIHLLDPLADANPNDLTLAYLLGTALLNQGQDQRGEQMIQRILKNGETAEAHMLVAYSKSKSNDKKAATAEVDRAIALNPNLPEAYTLRGRLAFLVSDLDGAEAAFRKAADLDPVAFEPRLWMGTLLRMEGKLNESRSNLERAMQMQPNESRVNYQFALLTADEGDDKKAAVLLEALLKRMPEYTEAHRSLSTIYFRLGRPADGREQKKIAEEMDAAIQAKDQERGRSLQK